LLIKRAMLRAMFARDNSAKRSITSQIRQSNARRDLKSLEDFNPGRALIKSAVMEPYQRTISARQYRWAPVSPGR
jgi:hypothetical protein